MVLKKDVGKFPPIVKKDVGKFPPIVPFKKSGSNVVPDILSKPVFSNSTFKLPLPKLTGAT